MAIFDNFDRLSFWLGFITALLFAWVVSRLSRSYPQIKDFIRSRVKSFRSNQAAGIDGILRQEVVKRAQRSHLAGTLFSLDEIIVTPRLLAPPPPLNPDDPDPVGSFRQPIVPPLPLVPQFSAQYGAETVSLVQVVRSGFHLAILGSPGAGKSTALAWLATLFARNDDSLGSLSSSFPIWLHINDLDDQEMPKADPLDLLIKAAAWYAPSAVRSQVQGFIKKNVSAQQAVVLLDGLDEVPSDRYIQAVEFLSRLRKTYPKLQIITAAAINRAYGLFDLMIEPLVLASWDRSDLKKFSQNWGSLWKQHIASQIPYDNNQTLDDLLINTWQAADGGFYTPLETTFRLWAAHAGDLSGNRGVDGIAAYLYRLETQGVHLRSFASLADQLITFKAAATTFIDAEKILSASGAGYDLTEVVEANPDGNLANPANANVGTHRSASKAPGLSSNEKMLDLLVEMGILREHASERLAFTSPTLWGFVASLSNYIYDLSAKSPEDDPWSVQEEFFHYLLVSTPAVWLKDYLGNDVGPFYQRSIQAGLWLRDLPSADANRSFIMRHILALVQSESVSYPTRLGLLGAVTLSNDPALGKLMHQLAAAPSVPLRQAAILCTGLLSDPKSISDLTTAGTDEQDLVRFTACFAIAALESPEAKTILSNTIEHADEHMRMVAAESVASRPPWGYDVLRDAAKSPDLLSKRAAIFGLEKIDESWVLDILERLSIEDGQYMVRNMASGVLEARQHGHSQRILVQPSPFDTPWLIAYAAKGGKGIPREESPVPLLASASSSGSLDQRIAAIQLLSRCPQPEAEDPLQKAFTDNDLELRIAAHHALWFMALNRKNHH